MGTSVLKVPRDQPPAENPRLRIVAIHDHKTINYKGDVFSFIELLMKEKWTGVARLSVNQGTQFTAMEFDFRQKVIEPETEKNL